MNNKTKIIIFSILSLFILSCAYSEEDVKFDDKFRKSKELVFPEEFFSDGDFDLDAKYTGTTVVGAATLTMYVTYYADESWDVSGEKEYNLDFEVGSDYITVLNTEIYSTDSPEVNQEIKRKLYTRKEAEKKLLSSDIFINPEEITNFKFYDLTYNLNVEYLNIRSKYFIMKSLKNGWIGVVDVSGSISFKGDAGVSMRGNIISHH